MKNSLKLLGIIIVTFVALSFQNSNKNNPIPAKGVLEIKAKSEVNFWKNFKHSSFHIYLVNPSSKNSCEAYTVKNGKEKWISPSLLANGKLDFDVPKNAHLFFKNFSNENLKITYTIE
jgi:hypothetical protein